MYGKTIELFLVNGTADSIITAELSNWNGKAIKIPRSEVSSCKRKDINDVGVYFLICQNDDGTESVYIGEAENVLDRLKTHIHEFQSEKEKFYWSTAVSFVCSDLNKAHIRYLENRFFDIAKECKRYSVLTKNTYKKTKLKESQIANMEEFIDNAKIVINALGYKILEPVPKAADDTVYYYCNNTSGAAAKGFISAGGFTVIKGSTVSDHTTPSFENSCRSYSILRNNLIAEGTISNGTFTENYEFSAPSAASSVVFGVPSNGRDDWKTEDNISLKDSLQ